MGPGTYAVDHGEKADARVKVWACIEKHLQVPLSKAHVLLLPAKEAPEMELLDHVPQPQVHMIDRDPQTVSSLACRFPEACVWPAGEFDEIVWSSTFQSTVRLDAAHVDFCGGVTPVHVRGLQGLANCLNDKAIVVVTYLNGRHYEGQNEFKALANEQLARCKNLVDCTHG